MVHWVKAVNIMQRCFWRNVAFAVTMQKKFIILNFNKTQMKMVSLVISIKTILEIYVDCVRNVMINYTLERLQSMDGKKL